MKDLSFIQIPNVNVDRGVEKIIRIWENSSTVNQQSKIKTKDRACYKFGGHWTLRDVR